MKRGRLRVLLGAAPGVGKTYEMLEEGRRLRESGRDVVIGVVETHERAATAALAEGLPIIPRRDRRPSRRRAHRDGRRRRARAASRTRPGRRTRPHQRARVAQREALAGRAGAAGCRHRRDHDGERAAHRVAERRRRADHRHRRSARRCRMPSCAPPTRSRSSTSRRNRCATGSRPASSIPRSGSMPRCRTTSGSATSRRCGNSRCCGWPTRSTARSSRYRAEHGIEGTWQARERVVVALTGGPEGETLIRRGARIAARSAGGELLAVHVSTQDGLRVDDARAPCRAARARRVARRHVPPGRRRRRPARPRRVRALGERHAARDRRQPARAPRRRARPDRGSARRSSASPATSTCTSSPTRPPAAASPFPASPAGRSASSAVCSASPSRWSSDRCCRGCSTASAREESITSEVLAYQLLVVVVALDRRHLAGAVRRRAVGPDARLPLRRAAVHGRRSPTRCTRWRSSSTWSSRSS